MAKESSHSNRESRPEKKVIDLDNFLLRKSSCCQYFGTEFKTRNYYLVYEALQELSFGTSYTQLA